MSTYRVLVVVSRHGAGMTSEVLDFGSNLKAAKAAILRLTETADSPAAHGHITVTPLWAPIESTEEPT